MNEGFQIRLLSKYRSILMGIAIIGILFCHYDECRVLHGLSGNAISKILALGNSFVDVFLLLSGIGLYYSYSKGRTVIEFYKKRFFRLLPAYFIIALPFWLYNDIFVESGSLKEVLYDFSFISLICEGIQRFWFVFLIGILYLLFPLFYKYFEKFKSKNILPVIFMITIFVCVWGGVVLKLVAPDLFANIEIAFERIPIFIVGIYFGHKCKENKNFMWWKIFVLFVLTIVLKWLLGVKTFGLLHDYFYYYIVSLQGLSIVVVLSALIDKCDSYKVLNRVQVIFASLGTVTLEAYLLHSAFKNLANYPSNFITYCLAAVILPVIIGYAVHFVCAKITKAQ